MDVGTPTWGSLCVLIPIAWQCTLAVATDAPIESKRFQNGSLTLVKNKITLDTWFLRFYEDAGDKRVYRRQRIGTVREFPLRRDAEKAVLILRGKINNEVGSPETGTDLIAHCQSTNSRLHARPSRR